MLGCLYYAAYYRAGFNWGDEGSLLLIASRLLAGEVPFVEVDIGYGPLWYYPLVALFKLTGVDFVAMRLFFLAVALLTSCLAFLAVRRQTASRLLPLMTAAAVLVVPGRIHKAYLPLIVVSGMAFVAAIDWRRDWLSWRWTVGAGLSATLALHIRSDLGLVVLAILGATGLLHTLTRPASRRQRAVQAARQGALLSVAALVPTLPLLLDAHLRGFLGPLLRLLGLPLRAMRRQLIDAGLLSIPSWRDALAEASTMVAHLDLSLGRAPASAASATATGLGRLPPETILGTGPPARLALLTYLPLAAVAGIGLIACWRSLHHRRRGREESRGELIGTLALVGLAFSSFPQFFVFRPDFSHLSQFMPGLLVLIGICLGRWWRPPSRSAPDASATNGRGLRVAQAVVGALLLLHAALYLRAGLLDATSGSIAARKGATKRFVGANGVDVKVKPGLYRILSATTRIAAENTDDGDYLLCFPYCPGLNVIADRPSFARRLYVDNTVPRIEPDWQARTIAQIERFRPPMIVIHDWAPNRSEASRFRIWADEVTAHVESRYESVETEGRFTFYVRRERLTAGQEPVNPAQG